MIFSTILGKKRMDKIFTLMLAGGSSNVNSMYRSPRLSEDRCLTCVGKKKKNKQIITN